MRKKVFTAAALDRKHKTFIVYITFFISSVDVYLSYRPQIAGLIT